MYKIILLLVIGFLVFIPACSKSDETEITTTDETTELITEEKTLEGKSVLMCIACKNFKDIEYQTTREHLETSGANIAVASNRTGECVGSDGLEVSADVSFSEVKPAKYDAIVVIGGPGTIEYLSGNVELHSLLNTFNDENKLISAICLAPMVLAEAGVLEGKQATVWESTQSVEALKTGGAEFIAEDVVVVGNIITANGPGAVQEFAEAIERELSQ
jgi:protease I